MNKRDKKTLRASAALAQSFVKPVVLSVHRNSQAQRQKHEMSREMIQAVKTIASAKQVDGYAIVAWSRDFDYSTATGCGDTLPEPLVPEFVKGALQHRIYKKLTEDNP